MSGDRVRDIRDGGFLWISHEVLRTYGAELGPYGIAVYAALCMFAGRHGESHPSIQAISDLVGASPRKTRAEIQKLVSLGLLDVTSNFGPKGQRSNTYTLLNGAKSAAEPEPEPVTTEDPAQLALHEMQPTPGTSCRPPLHDVQGPPAPRAAELQPVNNNQGTTSESADALSRGAERRKEPGKRDRKPDAVPQEALRAMVGALDDALPYPSAAPFKRHVRDAKRLIKLGYQPPDVKRTVEWLVTNKRDFFVVRREPLTMTTVAKYIGQVCGEPQASGDGATAQPRAVLRL